MIAYYKPWLANFFLQKKLAEANKKHLISTEELKACKQRYPAPFYMPNVWVRIGLFVLTVLIAVFSFSLFALMISSSSEKVYAVLLIFFSIITYAALEFIVRTKHHYKSGVDDATMWMFAIFLVSALNINNTVSSLQNAVLIFLIASYLSLRFANMIMTATAWVAFLAGIILGCARLGETAKAALPFLIMLFSSIIYFFASKKPLREKWDNYVDCLLTLEIVTLLSLYAGGNYYVVRETSIKLFLLDLKENESLLLGWLLWIFTIIIPFIYVARGIIKKEVVLIRVGLLLIAAIVFTIRHYYHLLPAQTAMIAGGLIMVGCAYALIKYLQKPRYGFNDEKNIDERFNIALQSESLLIAQTFGPTTVTDSDSHTNFGGGSGGGGGAGGQF